MTEIEFESFLTIVCSKLATEANSAIFTTSKAFEDRVREVVQNSLSDPAITVDFDPHPQAFPDIAIGAFGIEVKFTTNDTWRSIANSVLERNRIDKVKKIYLIFGKMGGLKPEVKWADYEKSVIHVRTSHVPRFEVEIDSSRGASLFEQLGLSYDEFRNLDIHEKMVHIRAYARSRLKTGERLWWLEDSDGDAHTLPMGVRLYTRLSTEEKTKLRAEAALLSPQIVKPGSARGKYDDAVLYIMTYHGVMCPQGRDLFSAGSVANPNNDDNGGLYIERSLKLLEPDILLAANRLDDALFQEYWGEVPPKESRISRWLLKADGYAIGWKPSDSLFLGSK
jgi:hypothetical protein